jgi:hypothetical protein
MVKICAGGLVCALSRGIPWPAIRPIIKHLIGSFFIGTAVHHLVEMADVRGKAMGLRRSSAGALAAAVLFGSIASAYAPARADLTGAAISMLAIIQEDHFLPEHSLSYSI